jgi:ribonucleoside-diphosphate reductase alpha chain/ribonucleoside-triphosphate reductase
MIEKRSGELVSYDPQRIKRAIHLASLETLRGVDEELEERIELDINHNILENIDYIYTVEEIQDMVETSLMSSDRKDIARQYILYRATKNEVRKKKVHKQGLLTDEFLSPYKHRPDPFPNELASFVYYRTYSRLIEDEMRVERWWETVKRAVEYNCSLEPQTTREEAEALFDSVYNLRQFLSGRTLWVGGSEGSLYAPMSNYNCAFKILDTFESFTDVFYLQLCGCGTGFRVLKEDIQKLPKILNRLNLVNLAYEPVEREKRNDSTSIIYTDKKATIIVGDSKEGWVQALRFFIDFHVKKEFSHLSDIVMDYSNVRKRGERLKRFGGFASGHLSLMSMFIKLHNLLFQKQGQKLKPIDCLDMANIIAENVVVGGVRRVAGMCIFDSDDEEIAHAKDELYVKDGDTFSEDKNIIHRKLSNNSKYFKERPALEEIEVMLESIKMSGEPGFINSEVAMGRNPNFKGVNPCGEVLLSDAGLCNLTTLNVCGFVTDSKLDIDKILEAQRLSVRAGYRITLLDLELPQWDWTQKRDRLLGCSLTGWQDMVAQTGMGGDDQRDLLRKLKSVAREEARNYAKKLGKNEPLLITTIKPEGTLSLLAGVSPGLHFDHSPYYIRRVRVNSHDPLVQVCKDLGYSIEHDGKKKDTEVIEFYIKSKSNKFKKDVDAIEQLEIYKMFMSEYVEHNASITVHVRDNEWGDVARWLWENWNCFVGISFLSYNNDFYPQMPYEEMDETAFNVLHKDIKKFVPSLVDKYIEVGDITLDDDPACASGVCPIR